MFKNRIDRTEFSGAMANSVFSNIEESSLYYVTDETLITVMRILLYPRLKPEEKIYIKCTDAQYTERDFEYNSDETMFNNMMECGYGGRFTVTNLYGNQEIVNREIEFLDRTVTESDSWSCVERITKFFENSFRIRCYINESIKSTQVFIDNNNASKFHYMQCGIVAMLPWYFDKESGLTEEEKNLLSSLTKNTDSEFVSIVDKFAEKYDMSKILATDKLKDFESASSKRAAKDMLRSISDKVSKISEYNSRIIKLTREKRDMEIKYLGYMAMAEKESSNDSQLMKYFLNSRNVFLENVGDDSITFAVKTYINEDPDKYKPYLNNPSFDTYRAHSASPDAVNDMKNLMRAIFIHRILKIRTCAAFTFYLSGGMEGIKYYDFGSRYKNYLPNPHIYYYRCTGDYTGMVNDMLNSHEYVEAIDACVISAGSLNFNDGAVMIEFNKTMWDNRNQNKFIETPDGQCFTPREAIEWLKSNNYNYLEEK